MQLLKLISSHPKFIILLVNINPGILNIVNMLKKIFLCATAGLLLTLQSVTFTYGQRGVSYQELANKSQQRNIFFDFFTLPGSQDSRVQFVTTFRIDYSFLPFKKVNQSADGNQFYSIAGMSMEVFKAKEKRKKDDKISVKGLQSVTRAAWKDTAYATTYEQTQSNKAFINGHLQVELSPGLYNYMLQLNRGEDTGEQNSRVRQVEVNAYGNQKTGDVLLAEDVKKNNGIQRLSLLNFGQNVYYGKNFHAFIHLSNYNDQSAYTVKISRLDISKKDTTRKEQVFQKKITKEEILTGIKPAIPKNSKGVSLALNNNPDGYTYALVAIPNSTFPNAVYQLLVTKEGQNAPVARSVFRSLWIGMPTSLLNLDVAIDMLRFIVNKEELKKIKSGSESEREKKFRKFWESKDPTPETEYNELMAEYYRRVDYAYEQFTTLNTVGYESDQGKIYIRYGPPDNIERKFPAGQSAVEIWTYDNRRFVFKATTGFGDFELVSK